MNEQILAKRYGDGYSLFVRKYTDINTAVDEIIDFKKLLIDCPQFLEFLQSIAISAKEKNLVIDTVLKDNFSDEFRIFLKFLVDKKETKNLSGILEYIRLTYSKGASINGVLTSTYPLESDVIEKIKEHMENKIQKKINLYLDFDPDLLGGVKFTIGNVVYDGSIQGNLNRIRKKLKQLKFVY